MVTVLERYLAAAREKEESWAPRYFELSFGRVPREDGAIESQVAPYCLDTSAGPVLFSGRIDRLDRAEGAIRLIDYKSGGIPTAKDILSGQRLQLSIYALAVETLLPGLQCTEALYLPVGKPAPREALGLHGKRGWDQRAPNTLAAVGRAVTEMRGGAFPPLPAAGRSCGGCQAIHACRFAQARTERKTGLTLENEDPEPSNEE